MQLVAPLKEELEDMRSTFQVLERTSSEAEKTLTEDKEEGVRQLKDWSRGALKALTALQDVTEEMETQLDVFRADQSPETQSVLSGSIRRSADQSLKVTEKFSEIKLENVRL